MPGQNRDEKVGMVHGRLAYMRQVAVRSRDGARRTPSTTIVVHVVRSCTTLLLSTSTADVLLLSTSTTDVLLLSTTCIHLLRASVHRCATE